MSSEINLNLSNLTSDNLNDQVCFMGIQTEDSLSKVQKTGVESFLIDISVSAYIIVKTITMYSKKLKINVCYN